MKTKKIFISLSLLLVVSCNRTNTTNNKTILNYIDLGNSVATFVATNVEDENEKMYGFEPKGLKDLTGTFVNEYTRKVIKSESIAPKKMFVINDTYSYLVFETNPVNEDEAGESANYNYLMNKKTGECFKFNPNIVISNDFESCHRKNKNSSTAIHFPKDKNNNIYFVSNEYLRNEIIHPLNKMDISDLNNIKISRVSFQNDSVYESFGVDLEGNVCYKVKVKNNIFTRCINKDGVAATCENINLITDIFSNIDGTISAILLNGDNSCDLVNVCFKQNATISLDKITSIDSESYLKTGFFSQIYSFNNANGKYTLGVNSEGIQYLYSDDTTAFPYAYKSFDDYNFTDINQNAFYSDEENVVAFGKVNGHPTTSYRVHFDRRGYSTKISLGSLDLASNILECVSKGKRQNSISIYYYKDGEDKDTISFYCLIYNFSYSLESKFKIGAHSLCLI